MRLDYNKIGNFIINERKAKKMTQVDLAKHLYVSEKTISKWETGRGVPDTNTLPKLCEIFGITINELLNGERFSKEEYIDKAEGKLLELEEVKQNSDKRLLAMEIVIGFLSVIFLLSLTALASFLMMPDWLRIMIIVFGLTISMVGILFALKIEQVAGYYICSKCNHKYVPTYHQVLWALHVNRTRYMKCPHCHKRAWHKKVIK
ncbi:MAG: helix-turn-helix transcriptional regulator [Clostridia bacterium]|nr:helix-turn-helix transcriptional regulator [Clostridia bacterium]